MSKLFFAGIPTGPDVRKLREAFNHLQVGDEIAHEDIENVLGILRSSNRYQAVTTAWRKDLLNNFALELGAVPGVGYRCLTDEERIAASLTGVKRGARQQMRSVRKAVIVKTDDPVLQRKQDVLRRFGAAMAAQANDMVKEIEPPKAADQMPRLVRKA